MPNSTPALYVKNPNYNPFDQRSNRYVTDAQAVQEAGNKATGLNDLFSIFGNTSKQPTQYNASSFYTPLAQPTIVPKLTLPNTPTAPVATATPKTAVPALTANPIAQPQPAAAPTPAQALTAEIQAATSGTLTPAQIAALATKAGQAGMSTADFMKVLEANATPTSAQQTDIRAKLGIPNLVDEAFKTPTKTLRDTYAQLYSTSGLSDVRGKIAALDENIARKRADLVRATGEINTNPWISQATRAGRLKNLQDLAFADINNDIESKNAYLDLYDSGVSEIEKQLELTQADQQDARQLTVDRLNYLLNEAERQTQGIQQDTITAGLRSVPDFLQGVLNREATQQQRDIAKVLANKTGSAAGVGGVRDGGTGGKVSARAQAVLDAPELLANYTPTERGKIVDELVNAGYDVGEIAAPKLGTSSREHIAQYDDLVRQGKEAETILAELGINTGPIASTVQKAGAVLGFAKDFTTYRSVIDNMGSTLLKLRSGAAVTPEEFVRIRGFIPQVGEDENTALTKIKAFYAELETARQNYVMRQTQTTKQIRQSTGVQSVSKGVNDYLASQGL